MTGIRVEGAGHTRLIQHVISWGEATLYGNKVYTFLVKGKPPYLVIASIEGQRAILMNVKRNYEPALYEELKAKATRQCKRSPCLLRDAIEALARGEEP